MSNQFKPGDLALVIKARHPENIGTCVKLVEPADQATEVCGELCWVVIGPGPGSICKESWLMPLRGDFQPEREKSKEADHA